MQFWTVLFFFVLSSACRINLNPLSSISIPAGHCDLILMIVPAQLMNVEGLTRENVASHLQKFRLQQKKDVRAEGNAPADALAATPGQHRLVSGGTGTGGGTGESGGVHSTEGPDQAGAHNGGSSDDPVSPLRLPVLMPSTSDVKGLPPYDTS